MITITDGTDTFTVDDDDQEIMETRMISAYTWIVKAVRSQIQYASNKAFEEYTDLNPKKFSVEDKKKELKKKTLKSAKEKNDEAEAEVLAEEEARKKDLE